MRIRTQLGVPLAQVSLDFSESETRKEENNPEHLNNKFVQAWGICCTYAASLFCLKKPNSQEWPGAHGYS